MRANPYIQAQEQAANELVIAYLPAVRAMGWRVKERLPNCIDGNDLISIGTEELIKLARRYDESINDNFWGYAKTRVRGAMLDYLRSLDPLSRADRALIKRIDTLTDEYLSAHDELPSDEWLAKELETDIEHVQKARINHALSTTLAWDDDMLSQPDSSELLEQADTQERLAKALSSLDERSQLIMQLYYFEELQFSEIAEILNLSVARISQLHSAAIKKLKADLNG